MSFAEVFRGDTTLCPMSMRAGVSIFDVDVGKHKGFVCDGEVMC